MYRLKNIAVGLGLLALFLLGPIFNTAASWMIADIVLVLFIGSCLSIIWPLRRLKAVAADPVVSGQNWALTVTNGYWPFVALSANADVTWRGSFFRHRQIFLCQPFQRGIYQQLPLTWQVSVPGLFEKRAALRLTSPVVVFPQANQEQAQQLQAQLDEQWAANGQNDFQIRDFHAYQVGDDVDLIDWRQTAKHGDVIVREFEQGQPEIPVFVLINQVDATYEARVSLFAGLLRQGATGWILGAQMNTAPTMSDLAALTPAETLTAWPNQMGLVALAPVDWTPPTQPVMTVVTLVGPQMRLSGGGQ